MNDLISRADLFDELNRRGVPYNAEVNMVINRMPSAQPEIVYCKDCEHYDDGLCRRWKYSHVTSEDSFCSGAERREE